jgi:CDP-diacylglycerol--glycerol-3-phosphate 3-phosphatidyltransferase
MKRVWDAIKAGYVRLLDPVAAVLVRHRVNPNVITTIGTVCSITGGVIYATGHISTGGWFLSITALFDVLDGTVARRSNRTTAFGAFYDSTLDRVADGAVLAGLTVFYATSVVHGSLPMEVVCLAGMLGGFLVSYTRARAEALGIDAKVGIMQRPERVVLLSVPQAFFGLALNGWVLGAIIVSLTVTSWVTAVQRIAVVYHATRPATPVDAIAATSPTPSATGARPASVLPVVVDDVVIVGKGA